MTTASIIISSYNYGRFVGEAIESALAHTYLETEVIVVDDGSTDDSPRVISSFNGRVRAILKQNAGQASALNAGFEASRGEVIFFLDSDDALLPDAVERAMPLLGDGVSKVHWPLHEIDVTGRRLGRVTPAPSLPDGDLSGEVLAAGPRSDANIWPPTSGNAWSRRFLDRVMPIPQQTYVTCPDLYLCGLAPLYGMVARCDQPLGLWRVHESNNTWKEPFAQRVDKYVALWDACCDDIERHARRLGHAPDRAAWRARSWWHRLQRAVTQVRQAIPDGESFILIDDEQWACRAIDARRALAMHPPADDAGLLDALAEHRRAGARHLVLAPDSHWWLEHYSGFARSLTAHRHLRGGDAIDIYELQDAHD